MVFNELKTYKIIGSEFIYKICLRSLQASVSLTPTPAHRQIETHTLLLKIKIQGINIARQACYYGNAIHPNVEQRGNRGGSVVNPKPVIKKKICTH